MRCRYDIVCLLRLVKFLSVLKQHRSHLAMQLLLGCDPGSCRKAPAVLNFHERCIYRLDACSFAFSTNALSVEVCRMFMIEHAWPLYHLNICKVKIWSTHGSWEFSHTHRSLTVLQAPNTTFPFGCVKGIRFHVGTLYTCCRKRTKACHVINMSPEVFKHTSSHREGIEGETRRFGVSIWGLQW